MPCTFCGRSKRNPPIYRQAASFSKAVVRTALAIVRGKEVFSEEELAKARIKSCMGCEYWNRKPNRCSQCGCFLGVKVKLLEEHCPINKW